MKTRKVTKRIEDENFMRDIFTMNMFTIRVPVAKITLFTMFPRNLSPKKVVSVDNI